MSDNMFAHGTARRPLARVATGFGVAMAAIATIGLGAGAAAAAPQQPFAADDPIPGMPGAGSAVNIANSLFGSLSGLMNNVFPGAGDLLMPASGALGGGGGLPGGLPGGLGGLGGVPGGLSGVPGGLGGVPGGSARADPARRYPGPGSWARRLPGRPARPRPRLPRWPARPATPGPDARTERLPGQHAARRARSAGARSGPRRPRSGHTGAGPTRRSARPGLVGQRQRQHIGARSGRLAVGFGRRWHERLISNENVEEDQSWPSEAGRSATASTARPITASGPTRNPPLRTNKDADRPTGGPRLCYGLRLAQLAQRPRMIVVRLISTSSRARRLSGARSPRHLFEISDLIRSSRP